jgi:hypothetical protein
VHTSPPRWRQAVAANRRVDDLWDESGTLRRGYWTFVYAEAAMAASLLIGGPARYQGPAFAVVRETGGATLWGLIFAGLAVLLLAARAISLRALRAVLTAASIVWCLWGLSFGEAALRSPTTSFVGLVAFLAVAIVHLSHAMAYSRRGGR